MAAGNEETAFFRFDTNAEQVAGEIAGAMTRIHSSLTNTPAGQNQLGADISGFQQAFARLQQDAQVGVDRIRTELGRLSSGQINSGQFLESYRRIGSETFAAQRRTIADELALMPREVAGRINVPAIMGDITKSTADSIASAVRAGRGVAREELKGLRFNGSDFREAIATTAMQPVDYNWVDGNRTQARALALQNEIRALEFLKADPTLLTQRPSYRRAGFDDDYMKSLQARATRETEEGYAYVGTSAPRELADLNREAATREATSHRLERQNRAEARSAEELAAANALIERGYRNIGGLLVPNGAAPGEYARRRGAGATDEVNPIAAENVTQKLRDEEQQRRNAMRLLENWKDVVPVNSYRVLNDEVYKLTATGAQRIRNEVQVKEALEGQARALAREEVSSLRLNELADKKALRNQQTGGGLLTGFVGRFHRGEQTLGNSLGGQIASAAAFSFAYGSIFALTNIMHNLLQEFLDYQDSVTDLEVATRSADVVTASWVNSLSEVSRLAGGNVGQALDSAARGIRAFSETGDSADRIRDIGDATTEVATKLALIANKSIPDATGDAIAVGTAFNLQADQLDQVVDAVANAKRNVGGDAAQISQGLSLLSLSAQEAGYNLNEAAAVIGLVQARTDQSGQAIATRLTRVFQIVSGSTGKNLARELGVDSTQSVKKQIEDFAKIYSNENTSEPVRDRISSALGGTANLRELLPLLNENETLQRAYADALENTGQGTDEFNRKSNNLVGTLKKISGDLKNIAVGLGRSGLFDFVGIFLKVLEPTLHGFNQLLNTINAITGSVDGLQTILGLLVAAAATTKTIGVFSAVGGIFSGVGGGAKAAAEQAAREKEIAVITAVTQQRLIAEGRYNEAILLMSVQRAEAERVAAAASLAGGLGGGVKTRGTMKTGASVLTGLVGTANPWVIGGGLLAIAGLAAYGKYTDNKNTLEGLQNSTSGSLTAFDRIDGSSESLAAAANDMNSLLGEIKKTDVAFYYKDEKADLVELTEARERGFLHMSRLVQKEEEHAAKLQQLTVFGDGAIETMDEIVTGLDAITAAGGTGVDQLNLLARALNTPPDQRTIKWSPEEVASDLIAMLGGNFEKSLPKGVGFQPENYDAQAVAAGYRAGTRYGYVPEVAKESGLITDTGQIASIVTAFDDSTYDTMRRAIFSELDKMNVSRKDPLTPEMQVRLAEVIAPMMPNLDRFGDQVDEVIESVINTTRKELDPSRDVDGKRALRQLLIGPLGEEYRGAKAGQIPPNLLNGETISRDGIARLLAGDDEGKGKLSDVLDAALGSIPESDDGTQREAVLNKFLRLLEGRKAALIKGGDKRPFNQLELLIANVTHQASESAVNRIEDLREAAETRAETNKELRAIRLKFAKRAFRAAGSDKTLIEPLMEAMDRQTIEAVRDYQKTAADIARQAYVRAQRLVAAAAAILAINPLAGLPKLALATQGLDDKYKKYKETSEAFDAYVDVLNNNAAITEDKATLPEDSSADSPDKKTAEERAQERADKIAAMAQARAARIGGGIASARAALVAARAQLAASKKGTTEYYQALASFYEAQWQMKEAVMAYQSNQYLLRGDMTDPVEQARDQLRAARDRLAAARSKDDKAAARVEVRQSEYALEKARWDQKLSDMQIAQQLGDISYAQYVRYLERESRRMHNMNHKTRQQIDYMNQIDLALQDAQNAAASQFNLGDINTNGFIYQTRRFAAEQRAQRQHDVVTNGQAQSSIVNSNNTVTINGTDTRMVRQILREMLGDAGTQRRSTNSSRRK